MSDNNDVEDDYKFARDHYYKLAEKGEEAIELMLELARDSEHPRAFEVLSTMLKQNAEVADRLMELQKKNKTVYYLREFDGAFFNKFIGYLRGDKQNQRS